MLSAASRPYIDASVPVLREHGLAITTHFYREMFADRPELTQLFNMGNQANGSQQQSLASAVFAYAANIDNAAALGPVVERIVHKHAAVGITPAHYPIVGRHLLGAISAVLGEAATPPLLAAWDEAYWLLAGELIAAEARLYQRTGVAAGELMPVRVVRREAQGGQVVALTLAAADGQPLREFRPGQYISVEARLDDGARQLRQYSLSAEAGLPTWRISVKREDGDQATPAGAVSNWLHANAHEGTELKVSAPFGEFTPALESRRPLVLLSGGIGITPMLSVLRTLAAQGSQRPVLFAHAARDGHHHAHRADLQWARERLPGLVTHISYEFPQAGDAAGRDYDHAGTMPLAEMLRQPELQRFVDGRFYLCGPLGFMQAQRHALLSAGVPVAHIEREVFGPDLLDDLL
ncbi:MULTISPECIES: globin domain-containing protein [Cupriavidus]|uniref:nitric oxide dioxygenase n=1 Tax=Cupriavidus taiwanensis TaxID=164546 RepID=A0A375CYD1_9BURK|nr:MULTISPECIES: globin domain-containing protein [Cupriavidus]MEC3768253.1 globin domain-containing protein [Cupriavidus sp. SS-3]SOY78421.1 FLAVOHEMOPROTEIN, Nitric oxide dioxygenase [Cupriavidus taiwanensis]SOY87708.1 FLAVOHEMOPROTEIN, Nitric oxide dioxygenase [Cupriavidus taiwanensis]SPD66122.1 Flavohemoprotein [Cupriavidus taiwanensis]